MQFSQYYRNINKQVIRRHIIPITILVVIALISYWSFYVPALYSDDWSLMVGRWYFGNLEWFDLTNLRPLLKARLVILYSIFGLNIHAFYIVLGLLNVLSIILLYFLLLRFIPKHVPIAFSIAALALIYPVDFTHMWLTMLQIWTVVLLTLLYAHLMFIYADSNRQIALWGALGCLLVSFGMHEGQLGVTMAWCLVIVLLHKHKPWKSLLPLLSPLVIGFAFVIWFKVGPSLLGYSSNYRYVNDIVTMPAVIIGRLLKGYQIMVWAWIEPLTLAFHLNILQSLGIILLAMISCSLFVYLISRVYSNKLVKVRLTYNQRTDQLYIFMIMVFVGFVFIAAGYIPVVVLFQPSLFPIGSRINLFPSMGASLAFVSLITVIAMIFKHKQPQINFMVLAATIPLIFLGSIIQLQVQYDNRISWEEQKQVWYEFFELIPDLQNGTIVYFIFADRETHSPSLYRTKRPTPLRGAGDVGAAINILYGKHNLNADVISKDLLLTEGVKNYYTGVITPYDHTVFVAYDGRPRQLRIIEDLEAENLVDFPVTNYNPYDHIIETPTSQTDFRWLVGVTPVK